MSEDKARAVPLIERLRKVPKHARHAEDWPASKGLGTSYYPTGALCHEAADALAQHQTERDSGAAPDERAASAVRVTCSFKTESGNFGDEIARCQVCGAHRGSPSAENCVNRAAAEDQTESNSTAAQRAADVHRAERDHARARLDRALRILSDIHAYLYPRLVEHDGKTYAFNAPNVHEMMQRLSDRVRAIPDEIERLQSPPIAASGLSPEAPEPDETTGVGSGEQDAKDAPTDDLTPPEALASRLIDVWCANNGGQIPWAKAVEITAIVTKVSNAERSRLLALNDDESGQDAKYAALRKLKAQILDLPCPTGEPPTCEAIVALIDAAIRTQGTEGQK
jgi:hypothetical protein